MDRSDLPTGGLLIERPRLTALLGRGLCRARIAMIAGPGYGKTLAAAHFARGAGARVAWADLGELDNLPAHLWQSLCGALRAECPALADAWAGQPFPAELAARARRMAELEAFLREGPRLLLALDHLEQLGEGEARDLLEALAAARIGGLCLLLISDAPGDGLWGGLRGQGDCLRVGAEELRFTPEEVAALLAHHQLPAPEDRVSRLLEETDGWPAALYLRVRGLRAEQDGGAGEPGIGWGDLRLYLRRACFAGYDAPTRRLLVRLSLLPMFTLEIIRGLGLPAEQADAMLLAHPFVSYRPQRGVFTFQRIYARFLARLQPMLEEGEIGETYRIAGECFAARGDSLEAAECFAKGGHYPKLMEVVRGFPRDIADPQTAAFLLRQLEAIPGEYADAHPEVTLHRGNLLVLSGRGGEAGALLETLAARLEGEARINEDGADEAEHPRRILGEACLTLAELQLRRDPERLLAYMRRASEYLPRGSGFRQCAPLALRDDSAFFLITCRAGESRRIAGALLAASALSKRLYRGCEPGLGERYAAEAAMHAFRFDSARELIHRLLVEAEGNGQHDLWCAARFLLLRIAVAQGDAAEARRHMEDVDRRVEACGEARLRPLRDCIRGWLALKTMDLDGIPRWIVEDGSDTATAATAVRAMSLRADEALERGGYHKALALAGRCRAMSEAQALWMPGLYCLLMEAVCQHRLGREAAALDAFHAAYRLTRRNRVLLPFAEAGRHLRPLVELARLDPARRFDGRWLEEARTRAATYAKHQHALRRSGQRGRGAPPPSGGPPLTQREGQILRLLSQGLTREEIAGTLGISIHGVKKSLTAIYGKLGAANRAEAVYLAAQRGIIEREER